MPAQQKQRIASWRSVKKGSEYVVHIVTISGVPLRCLVFEGSSRDLENVGIDCIPVLSGGFVEKQYNHHLLYWCSEKMVKHGRLNVYRGGFCPFLFQRLCYRTNNSHDQAG